MCAGHEVLMEVHDNDALIVGDPLGILGHHITFVNKQESLFQELLMPSTKLWRSNSPFKWNSALKKCKQLLEYEHLRLLRDIWWSKF